jgi:hypothetical protein
LISKISAGADRALDTMNSPYVLCEKRTQPIGLERIEGNQSIIRRLRNGAIQRNISVDRRNAL